MLGDPGARKHEARKDPADACELAGAVRLGSGHRGDPLTVRLAAHLNLPLADNFLMDLGAVHRYSSSGFVHQTREVAVFFPRKLFTVLKSAPGLAPACSIQDDARVPKSHRIVVPGNPTTGEELKQRTSDNLGDQGKITEFVFDERKHLAFVTIETPGEDDLSFEEVSRLLGDLPPYQVGPINLTKL